MKKGNEWNEKAVLRNVKEGKKRNVRNRGRREKQKTRMKERTTKKKERI